MNNQRFKQFLKDIARDGLTDEQWQQVQATHQKQPKAQLSIPNLLSRDSEQYIQEVQKQMLHLNIEQGVPFGEIVRYVAGEMRWIYNEVEQWKKLLPIKVIYAELDPSKLASDDQLLFEDALQKGELNFTNTPVGISVFFRSSEGVTVNVYQTMFSGGIVEAIQEILPQIWTATQRVPTLADVGNKSIEGLETVDLLLICKELSYYWYLGKDQYAAQVLAQFNRHWNQIEAAIKADGKSYEKRRADAKRHFKKAIKNIFEACERRTDFSELFTIEN